MTKIFQDTKCFFLSFRADVQLWSRCVHTSLEIHELHNIEVNLCANINRELLDELYIADAAHRRQMSEINVQF